MMSELARPKSTLSERHQDQGKSSTNGNMQQFSQGSAKKNASSQKKQRPGSNFI